MSRSWGLHRRPRKASEFLLSLPTDLRDVLEATRLTSQVGDTGDGPVSFRVHPQNEA
jgi:hypothetical protein